MATSENPFIEDTLSSEEKELVASLSEKKTVIKSNEQDILPDIDLSLPKTENDIEEEPINENETHNIEEDDTQESSEHIEGFDPEILDFLQRAAPNEFGEDNDEE